MDAPSRPAAPAPVQTRLDQVVRRVRLLWTLAALGRLALLVAAAIVLLYAADRLMELPRGVRAVVGPLVLGVLGRELVRRLLRPLSRGPSRLDAARLVERELPLEGRLVSALQLGDGPPGSFEHRVAAEAEEACRTSDLRRVLTARPALREVWRGAGAVAVLVATVLLARPHADVFVARWMLRDVPWPRLTHLALEVPAEGPTHVVLDDGTIVASRGGSLNLVATWSGRRPPRIDVVVEGEDGRRTASMAAGQGDSFHGHVVVEDGDRRLLVEGGDDDGRDTVRGLTVVEPPRLDDPTFVLRPPAYLGEPERTVGPADLSVAEGTSITVRGRPRGEPTAAHLHLMGRTEPVPLEITADGGAPLVTGTFVATESDSLSIVLEGPHGLLTPDPSHHALLVHTDRPPALRVYAPARSDVKVSPSAVVAFAVVAEDDHGVRSVTLEGGPLGERALVADAIRPSHHRLVVDMADEPLTGTVPYAIEVVDGRDLPGRSHQVVRVEGRRIDVVEASEVERLLADRQLRLKDAFAGIRERQERVMADVDDVRSHLDATSDSDLVALAVAQNQVTTRLTRESRELCAVLDETLTNRLDPGPGAEAVLERRMADWRAQPVDESFVAAPWRALASEYAAGRYGRLDLVGRLLDMAALALRLSEDLSPQAQERLDVARHEGELSALEDARGAQAEVLATLDRLLDRMDEWEDFQEVLTLVKSLIDDQRGLRERARTALRNAPGNN